MEPREGEPRDQLPNRSDAFFKETFSHLPSCRSFLQAHLPTKCAPPSLHKGPFGRCRNICKKISPRFGGGRAGKKMLRRLKRTIHVVDSTTIQLMAHSMDRAKHRRRKAAAKMHLRLNLQSFLPRFAIIGPAAEAGRSFRLIAKPEQAYLPGFE